MAHSGLTVHTEEGDVTGSLVFPTVRQFLGVPFATASRWEAPQPAPRRFATFEAVKFGSSFPKLGFHCSGISRTHGSERNDLEESEDSLTVNIWTRANLAMYQGENLVRDNDDIILVTVNYRLNILGNPIHLSSSIKWVHANIANFGGDPECWGVAVDLYAFAHPNSAIVKDVPALNAKLTRRWNKVAEAVGCGTVTDDDQLKRMKKVPAKDLVDAVVKTGVHFNPIFDEITLFSDMQKRIDNGNFLKAPLLIGTTQHEFDIITVAEQLAAKSFPVPVITPIVSDAITQYQGMSHIRRLYVTFNASCIHLAVFPNLTTRHDLRCYHGSEMPMVFGTYTTTFSNIPSTPTQVALSKYMQTAWVSFARDPQNGLKEFGWPLYDPNVTSLVQLGNLEDPTGAVFGSGKLLDSSCTSNKDTLLSVIGMLKPLLPGFSGW
ncbi:Alpha/Beta hydrolase protein [Cyathus striatus]|nr:Alpha/Beta hydrolase protein [Cyathus striatus]